MRRVSDETSFHSEKQLQLFLLRRIKLHFILLYSFVYTLLHIFKRTVLRHHQLKPSTSAVLLALPIARNAAAPDANTVQSLTLLL